MKKLLDIELPWRPRHQTEFSKCRIQIFQRPDHLKLTPIILTELPLNLGMSITNGAGIIVPIVLFQTGLHGSEVQFIEHYIRPDNEPDTWDLLSFRDIGKPFTVGRSLALPEWQSSNWKSVAYLIDAVGKEWKDL